VSLAKLKPTSAIERCRATALDHPRGCAHLQSAYNSCLNRQYLKWQGA
jgi:hypothetical protein